MYVGCFFLVDAGLNSIYMTICVLVACLLGDFEVITVKVLHVIANRYFGHPFFEILNPGDF